MRNLGRTWLVVLITAVLALLVIGFTIKGGYDNAVRLEQTAKRGWADVDAVLQRLADLIPNLVKTVRGYAGHEKQLFENIAKSREKYFQADSRAEKIQASNQMGAFLSRLLLLQEAYPELKANQNFLALQDQLEGTENRISVARTRYNETVRQLNTYCKSFFGRFFCGMANVEKAEYFEADANARQQVPEVDFNSGPEAG